MNIIINNIPKLEDMESIYENNEENDQSEEEELSLFIDFNYPNN